MSYNTFIRERYRLLPSDGIQRSSYLH